MLSVSELIRPLFALPNEYDKSTSPDPPDDAVIPVN